MKFDTDTPLIIDFYCALSLQGSVVVRSTISLTFSQNIGHKLDLHPPVDMNSKGILFKSSSIIIYYFADAFYDPLLQECNLLLTEFDDTGR